MKKILVGLVVVLATLSIVISGCSTKAKPATDPGQVIQIGVNQEFTIALGSNITTGYSWQPVYDKNNLTLINKDYKADDTTGKQVVGAGGTEYFYFKASKSGETKIDFTYYRSWETPTAQDKKASFTVNVK